MKRPEIIVPASLEERQAAIRALLRPCCELWPLQGTPARPDATKLLGTPYGVSLGRWPSGEDGQRLSFLGQLRMDELPGLARGGGLEGIDHGLISLFVNWERLDPEQPYVDRGAFSVLWIPPVLGAPPTRPLGAPQGSPPITVPADGDRGDEPTEEESAPACAFAAAPVWRLPPETDWAFPLGVLAEGEYVAYERLRSSLGPESGHRALGPAEWLGPDPRLGGERLELLWQIDSEPCLEETLGYGARLFLLLPPDGVGPSRLERARLSFQVG